MATTTTNLGKVSVTPKGEHVQANAYEALDIVTSGGSSYISKVDVPENTIIIDTNYWIMITKVFEYSDFTAEQILALQEPAIQAAEDLQDILDNVAIEMILTLTDPVNNLATGNSLKTLLITSELAGLSLVDLVGKVAVTSSSGTPTFTVTNLTTGESMLSTALTINVGATNSLGATVPVAIDPINKVVALGDLIGFNCTVAGTGTMGCELIPKFS